MTTETLTFNDLPAAVTTLKNEIRELKNLLLEKQDHTPTTENNPEFITPKEAADLLKVSQVTLWRYEKQGKVKCYGIGGRRLYKHSELINSLTLKK